MGNLINMMTSKCILYFYKYIFLNFNFFFIVNKFNSFNNLDILSIILF